MQKLRHDLQKSILPAQSLPDDGELERKCVPFLRWAGGKRWLTQNYPDFFQVKHTRYVEPFLGGASIFFDLRPKLSLLNDSNSRLIECYSAIRDDFERVEHELKIHQKHHSKEYYYTERSKTRRAKYKRAAQFIYLNRTCYNGLYRVNLKGAFNVPKGTKENVILPTDNFREISKALKNTSLISKDFESVISECRKGDLVYLDPPYTVKHNLNGFLKYNEHIFSWDDQIRLRDSAISAAKRGAHVVISNAAHSSIYNIYDGVGEINEVSRKSVIAGSSSNRGAVEEVVVVIRPQ